MPSIKQSADLLQQLKNSGALTEKAPSFSEAAPGAPAPPIYPNESNPRLRTPMPASTVLQPDIQRQFFTQAVPQTRILPQTAAANPTVGATAATQATTIVASQPATITDTDYVGINEQTGTAYTIQPSDFDTIISLNNNSGGTITLPFTTANNTHTVPSFVQSATATSAHSLSTAKAFVNPNTKGNTSLVFVSANTGFGFSPPPNTDPGWIVTVADTQGNVYTQLGRIVTSTQFDASDTQDCAFTVYAAFNIKAGANTVTATTTGSTASLSMDLAIMEYVGASQVTVVESISSSTATGVNPNISVTLTNLYAQDTILIVNSYVDGSGGTEVFPAGFTHRPLNVLDGFDNQVPAQTATYTITQIPNFGGAIAGIFGLVLTNLSTVPGIFFPKGWFCYIENTGTGTFNLKPTFLTIDGSTSSVSIGANQGLVLFYDGQNWLTERGIGGSGGGGSAGGTWNVVSKTANYTAVAGDMVLCDTSGGGFAVTIPLSASNTKKSIRVLKTSSDLNTLTPTASGSDTISGSATQPFNGQYTDMEITADGTATWWIV